MKRGLKLVSVVRMWGIAILDTTGKEISPPLMQFTIVCRQHGRPIFRSAASTILVFKGGDM